MLKIDLHLHTIASGHAHSTIYEYIAQAKRLGVKVIGITDHGPGNEETIVSNIFFQVLARIPKFVDGIRVVKGIEANIANSGAIDLSDYAIKYLDFVMAGLHKGYTFKDKGIIKNTESLIKAINSGKVNIISHPYVMSYYRTDIEKVALAACQRRVLLEIDTSYLKPRNQVEHQENLLNLRKMLKIVKKYKQKIIVGSDAHNVWEMGDDAPLTKIKKQIGLTNNLIINNYPKELYKILNIK